MLRQEKTVYDRLYLEGMSRPQLQAHAKRHNIKANGKTTSIIAELLGKSILEEEPVEVAANVRRSTRAGTRNTRNDIAEPIVEAKPATTRKTARAARRFSPLSRGTLHPSCNRTSPSSPQARSTSPYHSGPLSSAPNSPEQSSHRAGLSHSSSSSESTPRKAYRQNETVVPMKQTDKDVRIVRRHLTRLFNEQPSLQDDIDEMTMLLEYSQDQLDVCYDSIDRLSWKREAIEQAVVLPYKSERYIRDGTADMAYEDGKRWAIFANKESTAHVQLRGSFDIPGNILVEDDYYYDGSDASEDWEEDAQYSPNSSDDGDDREHGELGEGTEFVGVSNEEVAADNVDDMDDFYV